MGEYHAFCRQTIGMRRDCHRVTGIPHRVRSLLVGEDEDYIRFLHLVSFNRQDRSDRQSYQNHDFGDSENVLYFLSPSGGILDPLTIAEASKTVLELADEHPGERPVCTVLYIHSPVDHYAGVLGAIKRDDMSCGRVSVVAPESFVKEELSENELAGNVMGRRGTLG